MLIDDSSTPKAGKSSAGVARQYCGKLGKVENCQSGVFAILSKGNKYSMIDGQLLNDNYPDRSASITID